jgi:hypothetical protein
MAADLLTALEHPDHSEYHQQALLIVDSIRVPVDRLVQGGRRISGAEDLVLETFRS